ncbi:hypothetical protein AMELA_G00254790 [Ameiurus melas]|uniref:Uncharacterized protein n=1 Tax=Ameiurus melas TaxID=219545 RepID=A0A7J5ZR12_AMEME|nr:hypothetical protein AMELA_G00254790 [Ameiurus melas]
MPEVSFGETGLCSRIRIPKPMCVISGAPADQLTHGEMGESALSWEKIPALQQPLLSHSRPRYDRTREDCIRSGFSFLHLRGRRSNLEEERNYCITVSSEARRFDSGDGAMEREHAHPATSNQV